MRPTQSLFRLSAALAIGGLVAGPALAPPAYAQDAAAPGPASDASQATDPPARVGRLAALTGTVSFHTADTAEWQFATLNYPVTTGDAFWTEPSANAAVGLGDVKLVLDQQTEADIDTLDDATLAVTEPQGAVYLHVRNLVAGTTNTVTTPRGVVTITAVGLYEIVAGDADQPTRVVVIDGGADVALGNSTLHVGPQQAATISGSDAASFQGSVGAVTEDAFITAEIAKEQAEQKTVAVATAAYDPPPLVQHMTGYEELEQVGTWQPSPEYGHVWYPPVEANYVPYRNGHWAFVAPWGWTWVDNAPWGFAPFHYGRWAQFNGRWGWVPVDPGVHVDFARARPVYAPALVSFVGIGGHVGVGVGIGFGGLALSANVGWVPLAPREAYIPPFRASPAYVRNVNVTHVTNVTNITNITNKTVTINNYANAKAVTVVPAAAMTGSQPVARAVQPVTPQQLAAARPMAQAPVQPTAATAGVTPAVAKQMQLPPAPAGAKAPAATPAAAHPAPGPAIAAPAASVAKPAGPAVTAKPGMPAAKSALPMLTKPNPAAAQTHAVPAAPAKPAPAVAPAAKPAEAPAAKPAEAPAAKPAPAPAAKPAEAPAAKPATPTAKPPAEAPAAKPAPVPAAKPPTPAAKPAEAPAAKPAPTPAKPVEAPAAKPAEKPAAKPAEKPAAKPVEKPAVAPAAKPAPAPAKPAAEPNHPAAALPAHPAPAKPEPKPEPKKCPDNEKTC